MTFISTIINFIRAKFGYPRSEAANYIAKSKAQLRTDRLDMRYNPLAMDEDISGPWDRDPDWFKKNPDFLKDNPDFFFPKDRDNGA